MAHSNTAGTKVERETMGEACGLAGVRRVGENLYGPDVPWVRLVGQHHLPA
jgi:hypothetical protein